MKKLIYIFALIFVFGCSSSDDSGNNTNPYNYDVILNFDGFTYVEQPSTQPDGGNWIDYCNWSENKQNNIIVSHNILLNVISSSNNEVGGFLSITIDSSTLQEGQTYNLDNEMQYLVIEDYGTCTNGGLFDGQTQTVTITSISGNKISGNFNITMNQTFSPFNEIQVIGTFKDIPKSDD